MQEAMANGSISVFEILTCTQAEGIKTHPQKSQIEIDARINNFFSDSVLSL